MQQNQDLLQEKEAYQQQCDHKHRDTTAQLEAALEDARSQVKELSMQMGLTENKAQGLEEQLGQSDAKCRNLELKLAGLYSALRHTVGINRTRLADKPVSQRRSPSPWRRHMQVKGMMHRERLSSCL